MLDLFVATAEQEIAGYSGKGRCAKANPSHFVRTNVVMMVSIVPIMIIIFSLYAKGRYKNDQTGQQE